MELTEMHNKERQMFVKWYFIFNSEKFNSSVPTKYHGGIFSTLNSDYHTHSHKNKRLKP